MDICHPQGFRMEPHFTAPTGVENLELGQREGNEHPPSSARGSESTSHDAKTRSQSPDGEDSAFIPRLPLLGGEALFSGHAARVRTIYSIVD
ncbi:hypothetical protein CABS01_16605 [Colletotrichum abscissum]|uniref:uncharacterized protein n=1 Tax=Colletotrichum abscissum TaxID=1671311 RepID=UPI0027D48099|nr:uncharacterized protein CABS01_16605 [Colletotrichum abscissum]KAK1519302.1 hypothetical protein CABS01_16605 [Colletotrichum abscissum]